MMLSMECVNFFALFCIWTRLHFKQFEGPFVNTASVLILYYFLKDQRAVKTV